MFSRILVPLDGSERAERAIPIAVRLVRASGGSIILLRVVASPIEPAWQASESPSLMQGSLDADRVEAAEYLARISAAPVLAGVATSTRVYKGMPAAGILTVARSQQVPRDAELQIAATPARRPQSGRAAAAELRHGGATGGRGYRPAEEGGGTRAATGSRRQGHHAGPPGSNAGRTRSRAGDTGKLAQQSPWVVPFQARRGHSSSGSGKPSAGRSKSRQRMECARLAAAFRTPCSVNTS